MVVPRERVDLTSTNKIEQIITTQKPDLIINAVAYTAVDKAEQYQEACYAINAEAPRVMAEQAASQGVAMIHYSTDYVYDGIKSSPYVEDDKADPLGVYGKTKLLGDRAVLNSACAALIFRTSWVYGESGKNFYLTMGRLLQEREELDIVDDQVGSPTSAIAIANASAEIINQAGDDIFSFFKRSSGLYNMTCGGETSWFGFTSAIASKLTMQAAKVAKLNPIPTAAYPTPAKRPAYTVLNNDKLFRVFSVKLPEWRQSLNNMNSVALLKS